MTTPQTEPHHLETIARELQGRAGSTLEKSYIEGKSKLIDDLERIESCSEKEASERLMEMQDRGFVRFDNRMGAAGLGPVWRISPRPLNM